MVPDKYMKLLFSLENVSLGRVFSSTSTFENEWLLNMFIALGFIKALKTDLQ